MSNAARKAIIIAAREAAASGQHTLARVLFARVGISYHQVCTCVNN